MHTEEKWTAVITPHDRNLKREIAELWNYRELIKMFVKRDVKTMYAQTILGPLWFVVHSILSASVMTLVFDKIAGISTDGIPGFLFYMVGNVLWLNFSGCVTSVSETFLKNARLMGKVYFPRLSVPIATIISKQIRFLIQFAVFLLLYFGMVLCGDAVVHWGILITPVLMVELMLLAFGCGVLLTSFTTKYRDLSVLVTFFLQIWMYATPIVYPLSQVPKRFQMLFLCNPVAPIVETFRNVWLGNGQISESFLGISLLQTIIIVVVGICLFQRVQRSFIDTI